MTVPMVDFSPLGDLGKIYKEAQAGRRLADIAAQPGAFNLEAAARAAAAAGDQRGFLTLAQLADAARRDERDFQARRGDVSFTQGIQERQTKLAEEQAKDAARGFDYREIDDGMGNKKLVRIEKATGAVSAPPIAGVQDTPNNPFSQGKMNEAQSKDALYTSRMISSERILRDPAIVSAATSLKEQGLSRIPIAGNYMVSEAFQKYDQAQRDFINAVLRRESGAVISEAEFENARKQYFPQPGDTKERIDQKLRNRMEAIKGIGAGAGPGYRPDYAFDDKGGIIDNPAPKRNAPQAATLPRVSSPVEAAKLPKGTRFLDPNGVERIVP